MCRLATLCVLILLHMYPHTTTCVLILQYMCPHTTLCVLILHMCPHTTVYVSSGAYASAPWRTRAQQFTCFTSTKVPILTAMYVSSGAHESAPRRTRIYVSSYNLMCPHTIYVSSYYLQYVCPQVYTRAPPDAARVHISLLALLVQKYEY
jgi:hypothetical protein